MTPRDGEGPSPGGFGRTLTYLAGFDLLLSAGMVGTWSFLDFVDYRLAMVMCALQVALWITHLHHLFGPVRSFQEQGASASNDLVLEADAALQSLVRRSSIVFAGSWLGTELMWVGFMALGVPSGVPSGDAELVGGLLIASSALGLGTLARLLLESAINDARGEVGLAVVERGLYTQRPRTSFTRPMVEAAVWMLLGAMLVSGGSVIIWNARLQRAHAVSTQRQLVEHSLTRVTTGGEVLDGVELIERDALPLDLAAALEAADPGHTAQTHVVAFYDVERSLAIAAASLDDGRVVLSMVEPQEQLGVIVGLLAFIAFVGTPLFGVGLWLFGRLISAPLEGFADAAQQFVEQGELDALERIVPLRDDELGRLALSFNGMLDILAQLTRAAAAVSAGDLRVELEHPGDLHDAFRGMLIRLGEIVMRMRETSLELASATAEINALIQEQERAVLAQSANIEQVAFTVSSLATSAQQIADAAKGVRHDAEQAVVTTDATAEQIAQLRRHTASIAELLQVIGEIAQRSDLLALNGSLEATRAGEAGRGFALVAAEMRRLAERVTGTVVDVRGRVADVESSSSSTVMATEENRKLAQRTAEAARDISNVTATQSTDTEQASDGVRAAADMIVETTTAMSQIRASTEGLRVHAQELERLISSFEVRGEGPTRVSDSG